MSILYVIFSGTGLAFDAKHTSSLLAGVCRCKHHPSKYIHTTSCFCRSHPLSQRMCLEGAKNKQSTVPQNMGAMYLLEISDPPNNSQTEPRAVLHPMLHYGRCCAGFDSMALTTRYFNLVSLKS